MEHLWSRAVATGGKWWESDAADEEGDETEPEKE